MLAPSLVFVTVLLSNIVEGPSISPVSTSLSLRSPSIPSRLDLLVFLVFFTFLSKESIPLSLMPWIFLLGFPMPLRLSSESGLTPPVIDLILSALVLDRSAFQPLVSRANPVMPVNSSSLSSSPSTPKLNSSSVMVLSPKYHLVSVVVCTTTVLLTLLL